MNIKNMKFAGRIGKLAKMYETRLWYPVARNMFDGIRIFVRNLFMSLTFLIESELISLFR
jgi:hypothetical protein